MTLSYRMIVERGTQTWMEWVGGLIPGHEIFSLLYKLTTLNKAFSVIWYCHFDNFLDDTSYEKVNKHCHGWWMNSFIGQNPNLLLSTTCDEIVS